MFSSLEICVEGGDEAVLGVFAELPLRPPDIFQLTWLCLCFTFSAWLSVSPPLLGETFPRVFETPSQILYWQPGFT